MESVKDAVKDRQKRGKTPRKIQYDSYMQWTFCLMVSIVSVVIGFYLCYRGVKTIRRFHG